jgi:EmrB/QacA subfamily drug resistance transporter
MVVLDDTIVNVALPSIRTSLGFSEGNLAWVVNAYLLMFGGFLLVGGRAADLFGRRRMFAVGLALFTTCSLICGISSSSAMLIVARGLQGLGGAMLSPAALSILTTTFPEGPARTRALGAWGALIGVAGASGVVLSGVITDLVSWRWVFFINVPIGLTALALSASVIPAARAKVRTHLDLSGALLATVAMLLLVFTVVETSSEGWGSPRTLGGLGLAGALLLGFAVHERGAAEPILPPSLARRRPTQATSIVMALAAAGLLAMFFFLTLYMQNILGFSPLHTGLSYLPFSATIILSSALTVKAMARVPAWVLLMLGPTVGGVGLFLLSRVTASSDYAGNLLPGLIVTAAGLGLAFVPMTSIATDHIGEAAAGVASGLLTTCQQVGGAVGIAALVTIAANHTESLLKLGLDPNVALLDGFQLALRIGAALLLGAAVLVLLTRRLLAEGAAPERAPKDAPERAPKEAPEHAPKEVAKTLPSTAAPQAVPAASSASYSRSGAHARA